MIKTTDFRIGNYVHDSKSGEIMIVDDLGPNVGASLLDRSKYPLLDGWQMDGIPITEEWLRRLGFSTRVQAFVRIWQYGDSVHLEGVDGKYRFFFDDNWLRIVPFVHQLQNLYFALTGEELTIKEPA